MMPSYDALHFDPPAPVAYVVLRNPRSGTMVSDVPLLLDTGSDITLLPRALVEQIGISTLEGLQYELAGFDGYRTSAPVAMVDVLFLKRTFKGQYVLIDKVPGILGRDVLKHVSILLNGPERQWSGHSL